MSTEYRRQLIKMHTARSNRPFVGIIRDQRGQSLVLALMILFMLVFIGGLFVTLIVKNLGRTQRSAESMTAEYLAETGLRYASDQLTYSLDGADWRPVPNYPDLIRWLETGNPPNPQRPNMEDPDYQWLVQGFCRFTYANGRFLLRVTYDPKYGDPTSKYLKIESIGRPGIVDESDPTTLQLRQPPRLRSEKVAYKAIGITDYSRFITNLDRKTEPLALGVPAYTLPDGSGQKPFVTQYGELVDSDGDGKLDKMHGGSIRVNGNLRWYGQNFLWLDRTMNESVEVAGDITHAAEWSRNGPDPPANATAVFVDPSGFGPGILRQFMARQSSDPNFDTDPGFAASNVGVYRDGSLKTDVGTVVAGVPVKRPRGIQRLDPPLLDITAPGGGTGRYRELTRNSGSWIQNNTTGAWFNTGYYGWGDGLYINNKDDIQSESELRTLRDDWMTPGGSQYWAGPYYTPPGVVIVLTPFDLDSGRKKGDPITKHADMILMQTNVSGAKFNWYDPNGNILTPVAGQLIMPYPKNGVIFAEGNIRIKGTLPPHTNLTVVSGGTIYVEGNILKSNVNGDGTAMDRTAPRDSSIALLATDNVCINTTQFFGPAPESQTSGCWRPDVSCYAATVDHPLTFNFSFGEDPTWAYWDNGTPVPIATYVRHTADVGPSYMTMQINQAGAGANPTNANDVWFGLYNFGLRPWAGNIPAPNPKDYVYPLADPNAAESFLPPPGGTTLEWSKLLAEQKYPMWEGQVFTIYPIRSNQNYAVNIFPGANNLVTLGLDQNMAKSDYLLSRFAIQPCDIRIEALLYAQNGSFYVIPGEWFNPDPSDSRENVIAKKSGRAAGRVATEIRWPYYGDPLDVQVTIYGAVSENVPAPPEDEAAWMDKWGWIPPRHGDSQVDVDRTIGYRSPLDPRDPEDQAEENGVISIRQRGLSIIYDTQLSYPKVPDASGNEVPIRRDAYMRPLPITPKLPVSAQTLYFGTPA